MTYDELKTAIQNYVQTSEATFTGQINDFIRTAEDRVYRSVQMPAFWNSTAVAAITDTTTITLPAGAIEVYNVRVSKDDDQTTGEWTYLLRKDWDFLLEAYPGTSTAVSTGVPKYYAVGSAGTTGSINPDLTLEVAPKPSTATFQYSADYYGKVIADSITTGGDATVTWLSVTFPDILLHGALTEAYGFMKGEPGLIQYYEQMFNEGLATMASTVTGEQASVGTPAGA